jgi:diguanylate cyclase (GGDEF)-like protein
MGSRAEPRSASAGPSRSDVIAARRSKFLGSRYFGAMRDAHARQPADPGHDRDRSAEDRDDRAEEHDRASEARDDRADARDERAEVRERVDGVVDTDTASDRAGALRDRQGGASDRIQAADDRAAASVDRVLSARERIAFSIDELTGAHRREAGILELEREVDRATRTKQPFVLAFVDVDKFKATNDSLGHAGGDQRLRQTVALTRAHLRSYDLIIRFGGDEFLCALPDVTMEQASERFSLVNADLAAAQQGSVTVGLAELQPDDAVEDLIARADEAMYTARRNATR